MNGLVIFDLDGTLLCTHQHLMKAINETLREYGFFAIDDSKITPLIGENSEVFCKSIVPDCGEIESFIFTFREKKRLALQECGQLYDGIIELLFCLKP